MLRPQLAGGGPLSCISACVKQTANVLYQSAECHGILFEQSYAQFLISPTDMLDVPQCFSNGSCLFKSQHALHALLPSCLAQKENVSI